MAPGKLFGVSVGPGDPELLTLKAVRIIHVADVIAAPVARDRRSIAYDIAREHAEGKPVIWCPTPMTRDQEETTRAHAEAAGTICQHLEQGHSVAYLCLGDISLYSSFHHVAQEVKSRGYEVCVVPGVPSFCAAAAALGSPLCMGDERLLAAPLDANGIDDSLGIAANKVFLKPKAAYPALRKSLLEHGAADGAYVVSNCGLTEERIGTVAETDEVNYLTVVVVPDAMPYNPKVTNEV